MTEDSFIVFEQFLLLLNRINASMRLLSMLYIYGMRANLDIIGTDALSLTTGHNLADIINTPLCNTRFHINLSLRYTFRPRMKPKRLTKKAHTDASKLGSVLVSLVELPKLHDLVQLDCFIWHNILWRM
jgi:hypothetical protein